MLIFCNMFAIILRSQLSTKSLNSHPPKRTPQQLQNLPWETPTCHLETQFSTDNHLLCHHWIWMPKCQPRQETMAEFKIYQWTKIEPCRTPQIIPNQTHLQMHHQVLYTRSQHIPANQQQIQWDPQWPCQWKLQPLHQDLHQKNRIILPHCHR